LKKSLPDYIGEYGEPVAFIDHHGQNDKKYAVWGFDETIKIMPDRRLILNSQPVDGDPLEQVQKILDKWKMETDGIAAIGFLSYDIKAVFFSHITFKKSDDSLPYLWFGKPKLVREIYDSDEIPKRLVTLISGQNPVDRKKYRKDIQSIKRHLEIGNAYQVNYTMPMLFDTPDSPWDTYLSMRHLARPTNGMYLDTGGECILSISPEKFIKTKNDVIETFPIKGTRPRGGTEHMDLSLYNALLNSEKDRAEHLMIVDLMRNDLGKICEFGSVDVSDLQKIFSFPSVHHMISRVFGTLKKHTHEMDIFAALFPGGSITGAPKEMAMKIIDGLEDYNRGIYTGSLGYITSDGDMDFNIAIRTMTIKDGKGIYPVGGGIVWDSNEEEEWNEAHDKIAVIKSLLSDNPQTIKQ
jgi:aminodeoxychorismate synthase component I